MDTCSSISGEKNYFSNLYVFSNIFWIYSNNIYHSGNTNWLSKQWQVQNNNSDSRILVAKSLSDVRSRNHSQWNEGTKRETFPSFPCRWISWSKWRMKSLVFSLSIQNDDQNLHDGKSYAGKVRRRKIPSKKCDSISCDDQSVWVYLVVYKYGTIFICFEHERRIRVKKKTWTYSKGKMRGNEER